MQHTEFIFHTMALGFLGQQQTTHKVLRTFSYFKEADEKITLVP